jgi:hypothetical protein
MASIFIAECESATADEHVADKIRSLLAVKSKECTGKQIMFTLPCNSH